MNEQSRLDERYGRSPGSARRTRWVAIAAASAFALVFAAWLLWGGLGGEAARFEVRDTGYTVVDDRAVEVEWSFTAEPGTAAHCAVQALNSSFGIVGWKVVEIPPSPTRTRTFTDTVLTTEEAVTGLIYRCWLV